LQNFFYWFEALHYLKLVLRLSLKVIYLKPQGSFIPECSGAERSKD